LEQLLQAGIQKTAKMKNLNLVNAGLFVSLLTISAVSCDNAAKGDKATITEEQKAPESSGREYTVDTSESRIKFTGYGVGKNHPGKFRLISGNVSVNNNKVTGGNFLIDIRSMEMEQKGEMFEKKLRPHLLSGDFFDAEKFGTAKFEITGCEPYEPNDKDTSIVKGANFNISGNLTIKDQTRNITFPAKVDLDDNTLKGKADFDIDRTQWKMNYGNDKTLGDKFISEKVNVELDLEATSGQTKSQDNM
jgi:polyisoprenoid-binding protein YceI